MTEGAVEVIQAAIDEAVRAPIRHSDLGMYVIREAGDGAWRVIQRGSGQVVAEAASKATAGTAANALNACAIVPLIATASASTSRLRELTEALEPFAKAAAERIRTGDYDDDRPAIAKVSDFRRAQTVWEAGQ